MQRRDLCSEWQDVAAVYFEHPKNSTGLGNIIVTYMEFSKLRHEKNGEVSCTCLRWNTTDEEGESYVVREKLNNKTELRTGDFLTWGYLAHAIRNVLYMVKDSYADTLLCRVLPWPIIAST